jgi:hypothetical protein
LTVEETNRATVARLTTILSGELPIHAGAELIAPDVAVYVDDWQFEGINVWANWIDYLRTRDRVAEPTLLVDELEVRPDAMVTVRGRWQGLRNGRVATSRQGEATYRLSQGRIVEIWSTRSNYAFLCGAHLTYNWGFALEMLRSQWWRLRVPRLDLVEPLRLQSITMPSPSVANALFAGD